jgi:putative methyltransferase (TIGR04325 family)
MTLKEMRTVPARARRPSSSETSERRGSDMRSKLSLRILKSSLHQLLPPILFTLLRLRPTPVVSFTGDYPSWSAAAIASRGYNSPLILDKVRTSALSVKRGEATFERDSVTFHHPEIRWPLLACIFHAALQSDAATFHVIDFGGSLGSTYFQHRTALAGITHLMWSIIEQPHYVLCGQQDFSDDVLQFFDDIRDAEKRRSAITLVLLSGVLQYIEDPGLIIDIAKNLGAKYLLLDRTPVIDGAHDRITVQHVTEPIYDAEYPHRFFSRDRLLSSIISRGYNILYEFRADDKTENDAKYIGLLCEMN